MKFNEKYKKIKALVGFELNIIQEKMVNSVEVREPLNSGIKNFLILPSKRIRSVFSLLYLKAYGVEISEKIYEFLTAVELIHNASLFHDDVIDNSDTRRSHKTLSAEFDNKLAIISGDYLLSVAMKSLSGMGKNIVFNFSDTFSKMCMGEINQNFDKFEIGTIENYIEKTKAKTAYLFSSTLVCAISLLDENVEKNVLENAYNFAINFGIAFQIRDDLLNLIGSDISKPGNNDIKSGIYTAPIIYAGSVENYEQGIEKTRVLLNNYIENARNSIRFFENNTYKQALEDLLELLENE